MPEYLSPGVYVEEVEPLSRPIAGVGTTTAGFVGVAADVGKQLMPERLQPTTYSQGLVKYDKASKKLTLKDQNAKWPNIPNLAKAEVQIEKDGKINTAKIKARESDTVLELSQSAPSEDVDDANFRLTYTDYYEQVAEKTPRFLTSWQEFRQNFGDIMASNEYLAHAVYGFFNNGGTKCWVARVKTGDVASISAVLDLFAQEDDISMVSSPLSPTTTATVLKDVNDKLIAHCESLKDRVAVLDTPRDVVATPASPSSASTNGFGALYYPWALVRNPLRATDYPNNTDPDAAESWSNGGELKAIPPSGLICGVYARSDGARGVHKAPANEALGGVVGLRHKVNAGQQDRLNPHGVNCIRLFNGNPVVWGARTLASNNGDPQWKYVNVRRFMNFLRESIDEGTRWVVFEPNNTSLWKRIKRSVSDFLLAQWRAGALFGATPEQAFFVKCDEETNPSDVREAGQVVTEIGVAITKPAEFVIFRIQQTTGG